MVYNSSMSEKLSHDTMANNQGETTNANSKNGWSELEELGKKGFKADSKEQASVPYISHESKRNKIFQAAKNVHAAYKNRIAEAYDAVERKQVDEARESIDLGNDRDAVTVMPPTEKRKFLRLIGDKLGIRPKKDQERRRAEASSVAWSEYLEDLEKESARKRAFQEQIEELNRSNEEIGRRDLERKMAEGHSIAEHDKQERFEGQRIQEMVEKELNEKLLKVDDLEIYSSVEGSGVTEKMVEYEGTNIPVYNLDGLPFSMLSTTIDYRADSKEGERGSQNYQPIIDNPSTWLINREEAKAINDFNNHDRTRLLSNNISASYYGSEHNMQAYVRGDLIYGFDHVDAGSVYSAKSGDSGTGAFIDETRTDLWSPDAISNLEKTRQGSYNEVVLNRYSENGVPKRPDYIVTRNRHISEAALRHASYFGIPIVNINDEAYKEQGPEQLDE